MDVDEKKRKIEKDDSVDVESVLKSFIESNHNLAKLVNTIAVKVVNLEKVFNKDLFKE